VKTRSLLTPADYIWSEDPDVIPPTLHDGATPKEIDAAKEERDRLYVDSLCDPQYRPIREGGTPAKFRLAPLSRKAKQYVQRVMSFSQHEAILQAAYHALVAIADWEHNGKIVSIVEGDFETVSGLKRLSEKWLDEHERGAESLFLELGGAALSLSGLRPMKPGD